jgi:hypothetical protein
MKKSFSVASVASIALLMLVGAAGCGASAEAEPAGLQPIGVSQSALGTGFGHWSKTLYSAAENFPIEWSPGVPVTGADVCFLTGVYGGLVDQPVGTDFAEAAVGLNSSTNQWQIEYKPGTGTGLRIDVACVDRNTNKAQFTWTDYTGQIGRPNGPSVMNAASSDTQCFIQSIMSKSGLVGEYNGSSTGVGLVFYPATSDTPAQWYMYGNTFPQEDFDWGLRVGAICVDIPNVWTGTGGFGQVAGGGLVEHVLVSGAGTSCVCGMTSFDGDFADADVTVNTKDGAGAAWNVTTGDWNMFADSAPNGGGGMGAGYGCVSFK